MTLPARDPAGRFLGWHAFGRLRLPQRTHTGDYSDVVVIDAGGPDVSRIGNDEMRDLMRQVVNRLYTYQMKAGDSFFVVMMDRALTEAWQRDEPELDEAIVSGVERARLHAD